MTGDLGFALKYFNDNKKEISKTSMAKSSSLWNLGTMGVTGLFSLLLYIFKNFHYHHYFLAHVPFVPAIPWDFKLQLYSHSCKSTVVHGYSLYLVCESLELT